jgi:predicted NBD/HSP70 family sugar kinase
MKLARWTPDSFFPGAKAFPVVPQAKSLDQVCIVRHMALLERGPREWGTNLARVKDYNEVVVLDLVRSNGPLGRPAIASATGLTLQTVSNIARRLLAADTVVEEPVDGPGYGRVRRTLRVNPDAAYAVGIQLVRSGLAAGVVDLAGEIRGRAETAIGVDEAPEPVLRRLAGLVDSAIASAGVAPERVLGAGIGAPGPVDLGRGSLLNVLHPRSWSHFPMADAVAEALGMRVIMDNDATAAALGEQWRGVGGGCESFIYLYLGTGIGSGLVLGGQAYRGRRGNAGEISHIQVDPDGPPCDCGSRGCLALYVTPDGLLREARRAALEARPSQPVTDCPATLEELVAHPDPRIGGILERAGAHLGRVVLECSRVLDPELIVLGGPLVPVIGERFGAAIARELERLDEPGAAPPRVELSTSGSDAGVIGAATLVLHDLYAPTAHKLSLAGLPRGQLGAQAAA